MIAVASSTLTVRWTTIEPVEYDPPGAVCLTVTVPVPAIGTVSVDDATAIMTVRYSPEKPLFCEAMSGTTVLDQGPATAVAPAGSPTYYQYEYSYAAVPVGTGAITLQCGGDNAAPTTYQISTTR